MAREQGLDLGDEELLRAYADNEAAVELETPAARYPDVLATAFRGTAEKLGAPVSDEWARRLGESVPDWPARGAGPRLVVPRRDLAAASSRAPESPN